LASNLEVSASGGLVLFSWRGQSSSSDWKNLKDFWSQFAIEEQEFELRVPTGDFYVMRSWFQAYWLNLGLELEQGPGLAEAISRSEDLSREFELLSKTPYAEMTILREEIEALGLKRDLTKSQWINVLSMVRASNSSNFSVPGAGKTATQLVVFELLRARGLLSRMLVVCPKSSFEAWRDEPSAVFSTPPSVEIFDGVFASTAANILVANFEKVESVRRQALLKAWLASPGGSALVVDEAHRIKGGPRGVRWRSIMGLSGYAERVDLLSGTPMPQSYEDLKNLFSVSWKTIPRQHLQESKLANLTPGGLFVRTTKAELNLPEIEVITREFEMGRIQREIYNALGKSYVGTLSLEPKDQFTLAKKGRAIMTLLAASTNPALIGVSSREEILRDLTWPPKELAGSGLMDALMSYMQFEIPPKYEWVIKFLETQRINGKKTLVWSSFVGNLEVMRTYLEPFNPAVIHGSVSKEDREYELNRFRNDPNCHVLLTNPQTLGEGISLHMTAHEAVFLDRTYNAAQYLQALDRIHRLGLPEDVKTTVYLLSSKASVDQRVANRLEVKIKALSQMLDDPGLVAVSLPSSDELEQPDEILGFDNIDLDDLLAHLRGL
jgi:hypothetical protein